MASTYSSLKIELIGTGDQAGTWGNTTNTNLGTAIEEAVTGSSNVTFASSNAAIALTDTNAAQVARNLRLNLVGTIANVQTLFVPAIEKQYLVTNGLSNSVIISNGSNASPTGTTVTIPTGRSVVIFNDATNIAETTNYLSNLSVGNLTINGGTANALSLTNVSINGGTANGLISSNVSIVSGNINSVTSNASTFSNVTINGGTANNITVNKVTITAPATSSTLTIANGKTLTANNSIELAGTDATTMTFPPASSKVGYLNVPPVGTKTSSYTLTTADVGEYVQVGTSGAIVIPDATFAEGDIVAIFNNTTGGITITCTITTAYIAGTDTDKATVTLATRGVASILFISGTVCVITGNVT
jgi:hypothetical protein